MSFVDVPLVQETISPDRCECSLRSGLGAVLAQSDSLNPTISCVPLLSVLLWHRSDNLVFVLVLGGAAQLTIGEGVECKLKGVLQVVDDVKGPVTRKDYDIYQAPAGDALFGKAVNCLGYERVVTAVAQPSGSASQEDGRSPPPSSTSSFSMTTPPVGFDKVRPLINQQVDMQGREQITECLLTGVKVSAQTEAEEGHTVTHIHQCAPSFGWQRCRVQRSVLPSEADLAVLHLLFLPCSQALDIC